ncbi:HlyD family secretion protein [Akkermansiaceae bacterium]|nr:HlyD family secretion protein [Akkermansiaceae bacterium]MDB4563282.1 HlyD family secretion protein [bacterium]MDB4366700.1 HlyD family secretion protein [Akkermansiaceae bacterium]MDB4394435.1 HlyD family secretion protein [Akkermansiaceae bacterium]MDB4407671.1 HlyD family secretion protein [Akkermansiaceae bacterium]
MTSAIFIFLSKIAFTASITIGGGSFANVLNGLGDALPEGSQIQVGSFDGVEPSKSGADFTSVDWQSFNPFLGIGSTNPDEVIGTFSAGEGLESVFQISSELDAELGDLFPSEFPVRLGLRIFDTTANSLEGVAYNTVVRDVSTWVFNDPEVITNQPPTPSIATEDDSLMFWEDNENPFQTSITTTDDSTRIEELEAQLASVIAERDARPTQEDYDALIAERDENLENYTANLAEKGGVITTLSESITEKDAAYALVVAERDENLENYTENLAEKDGVITTLSESITEKDAAYALVVVERDENLENYTENLAEKDGVITTLSESITEKDAAYALVVAERDSRFEDTDADGITDIKEIELETDPNVGTVFYLNNTEFETAVASARETGQNDVIIDPLSFGLVLGSTYEAVIAERDARFIDTDKDGLTDLKEAELESDNNELTPFYLQDAYELGVESARFEGRTDVTNNPNAYSLVTNAQYNFVVAERDGRPTQEDLAEVIAERDARPTLGEVKDARLGSVVLQSDNANNSVKIRFSIEETDDFKVWTKRDGVNEVTVPLEAGSKFYRFALQDE